MIKNIGAERAVLSGICQYGVNAYFEVSDILNANCFTSKSNQIIYRCLEFMFMNDIQIVDFASLISAASTLKYEEEITSKKEDLEYIRSLFNYPINLENIRQNAIIIFNLNIAREGQSKLKKCYDELDKLSGQESITNILEIIESPYTEILKEGIIEESTKNIGEDIEDYVENKINNPVQNIGIPTPFRIFNSVVGDGLRTGVHLIAARLKVGKSSFAKEIALHIADKLQIPILYIDTEMQETEQKDRILASYAEIDIRRVEKGIFTDAEKDRIREAAKQIAKLKFKHERVSGKSFKEILSIMRRWINHQVGYDPETGEPNPHMIVYDYFKLMDTAELKNAAEYQLMGFQIAALHDFCAENKTPVLSFVQINRDGINKDSTDVIAQSDRLGWNAISICLLKRKAAEEIAQDGPTAGTHKLIPLEGRFMKRLDDGDYINFHFDESKSKFIELGTKFQKNEY